MRLSRLELLAYGPFRGLTLDLARPGVHVIIGRNEAGKSTTLRAITGLLYGIDAKTPDAHVHENRDLRIGGVLESAAGERLAVVRRKGNTNTLLDADDRPVDEARLRRLLAGVSRETFTTAYGLDHDTLAAGARALLEGKGDLGESLFDASVGGGGEVQRLLADLSAEADRIYKPRASALPLNEALKAFTDAQKTVRARERLPEAFLKQEAGVAEAAAEHAARMAERAELVARRTKLARARTRLLLEKTLERARAKRTEHGPLSAQVDRVLALRDRFVGYDKAVEQRREHAAERERLADRIVVAARRAGTTPDAPRLDARQEGRIRACLADRAKLLDAIEAGATTITKHQRDLARVGETTPAPAEGDRLERALERARLLGDIEARVARDQAKLSRQTKDLETRARTMFEGSLDAFVALRLPAKPSVERLETRAGELERKMARLEDRRDRLDQEGRAFEKQIATQSGDFEPPDARELARVRAARDDAWKALLLSADDAARRSAEMAASRHMGEADAVADRMIREADRVISLARLRSEAAHTVEQQKELTAALAELTGERAALDAELAALLADAGVRPGGFAETEQWLDHHAQIAEAHRLVMDAEATLSFERAKVLSAATELARELDMDEGTLVDHVAVGTRRLAALETERRAASDAERVRKDLGDRIHELTHRLEEDGSTLDETRARLAELVAAFGMGGGTTREEVDRTLEALRELFGLVDKRVEVDARARAAEADVTALEAALNVACSELAPDLASSDARSASTTLFARALQAKETEREIATTEEALEAEPPLADASGLDPEEALRLEEELGETIDRRDREISEITMKLGGRKLALDQMRVDTNAAEAAEAAQEALARVRGHAERWARVKLASVLLGREIDRYREEHQGPLLLASSGLFSTLTLGAFAGIKAGFDDKDRACLVCVRADGGEVAVAGLSDGTRDQLYLSLRLASLLRRAELAEPMPLVLDDVLIQLDDERAEAALGVLAEVSRTFQVLFFTHHARLVELARSAIPADRLVIHELAGRPLRQESLQLG